jgi:hypothetical protein
MSGYWSHPPSLSEAEKVLAVFAGAIQLSVRHSAGADARRNG